MWIAMTLWVEDFSALDYYPKKTREEKKKRKRRRRRRDL
jgi:hypothetical protein